MTKTVLNLPKTLPDDTALLWLRNDLRIPDNPALAYALRTYAAVLCVYINPMVPDNPPANAWWLREALLDFSTQLQDRLLYLEGDEAEQIESLLEQYEFAAVCWNRRFEPELRERDAKLKQTLKDSGMRVASFAGNLLFEPWEISKADESPYRVFTPFYKAALAKGEALPYEAPGAADLKRLVQVGDDSRARIEMLPSQPWMEPFAEHWTPTRAGVEQRLAIFAEKAMADYAGGRDVPAEDNCSRLSPWLHHGQIGAREVAALVRGKEGAEPFVRELVWREFAHYIIYHWPHTENEPMDQRFEKMQWQSDGAALRAWQRGQTGIPLVDAGMRELWQTGIMHNRVRMVVASLLTKHLLIDWRKGAEWFEYTLLDADTASNRMGWQWCAGSGVDAAPYFRIFNPVAQGERFDKEGRYVRRWVPELEGLPDKWLHNPWEAPAEVLRDASVELGKTYPRPIIDLKKGRERALQIWSSIK